MIPSRSAHHQPPKSFSGCVQSRLTPLVGRQLNFDLCSVSLPAFNFYSTAMLLNNLLRVRHAEAETAALGRVEWFKNLLDPFRTHSGAGVLYRHPYLFAVAAGRDRQASAGGHGLNSIQHEV